MYLKWQEGLLILLILIAAAFILISLLEINLNTGLYGKVEEVPQRETTPFHPYSPYAVAKQYG